MKFEVFYNQEVRVQAKYVIECENEDALIKRLEESEDDMAKRGFDRFDDLYFLLKDLPDIKVIKFDEEYSEDWEAPEYYDHVKVGD
ncbi:MAG: hypothetical protein IKY67_06375 [Paludibacteraceae bacterium]|nr:hypothetical protein [Paludibacteraceae bacterium]